MSFENKVSKKQISKTNSNQDWNSNLNIKKSHEIKTQNEKKYQTGPYILKDKKNGLLFFK